MSQSLEGFQAKFNNLGTIPLSGDILTKANIGLWAFELDEGENPRMYVDDTMLGLIGLEKQVSPEETYHAWYDHIDPEHYEEVAASVEKMTAGIHAEVQYPWHHPNGEVWIVRCGGVRNYAYTKGIRIEGTHQNVSEMMHFEKEKQKELSNIIEAMSSDYECLLHADFDRDKEEHYRLSKMLSDLIPGWSEEKTYSKRIQLLADNIIIPEDREKFLKDVDPAVITEKVKDGNSYFVYFRVEINQKILWFQAKFIHHIAHFGHNCALIGISNADEAIHKNMRERAVMEALGYDFSYVSYIEEETLKEEIYRCEYQFEKNFERWNKIDTFDRRVKFISEFYVHPEDREKFIRETDIEYISKELKKTNILYTDFRVIINGKELYYQGKFVLVDIDGSKHIVVGFKSVDDIARRQIAQQNKLKENFKIIDVLASEYASVFYINPENDAVKTYSVSSETMMKYSDVVNSGCTYSEGLAFFAEHLVYAPDKQKLLSDASLSNLKKQLAKQKSFTTTFRGLRNGEVRYCEMKFVKPDSESEAPTAIVMGFADRDEEIIARFVDEKLMSEYASIFLVDLKSDDYRFVYRSKRSGFPEIHGGKYSDAIRGYVSKVAPEYCGQWEKMADIGYMSEYLARDDRREYVYKFKSDEFQWRRCVSQVIERKNGVPTMFIMTFTTLDDSSAEKFELDAKISEQKEELEKKQVALEEALSMAQSANRAKTTFLNNMSHDIRTPMNAIIGFTGLAASHIDNKDQVRDYLKKIGQSSEHLLSLINDVLDMSRIEAGKMNLNEKPESLSEIVHSLRDIVQADIHAKQLDFFIDSMGMNDENVICDKLRLNQVLLNILSNSIKYTPVGGTVSLRISEKGITNNEYGMYEFRIKDNGIGMSKEFLKTLFDPFTRVNSSTVSGIQGTGLGMAITKSIVDMMNGKIEVTSEEGKGTETVVEFEFRLAEKHKDPVLLEQFVGLRGLVVDDDINACTSVSQMLRDIGMRPEWCVNGKEAIARAEEAFKISDAYKVYIVDWLMPDMNGIETVRGIRRIVGDDVPIIILSAYDYSDIMQEATEAGVTGFIAKPMFPSDLYRTLKECCGAVCEPANNEEKPGFDFTGKKVLLVEDNELNREIATEILEEEGFFVSTAEDGNIAVSIMQKAVPGDFDLILMDVQMPVMDGYEATKCIRNIPDPGICNIPIIAMTANAFEEDRLAAIKAGMNEHIAKPIDIVKFKNVLSRFLK